MVFAQFSIHFQQPKPSSSVLLIITDCRSSAINRPIVLVVQARQNRCNATDNSLRGQYRFASLSIYVSRYFYFSPFFLSFSSFPAPTTTTVRLAQLGTRLAVLYKPPPIQPTAGVVWLFRRYIGSRLCSAPTRSGGALHPSPEGAVAVEMG